MQAVHRARMTDADPKMSPALIDTLCNGAVVGQNQLNRLVLHRMESVIGRATSNGAPRKLFEANIVSTRY